jgi:hypothetical protein
MRFPGCKPLIIFLIFQAALITYHLTQSQYKLAYTNFIMTIFGSVLLHVLCSLNFELLAWLLLAFVPFFFVVLLAIVLLSRFVPPIAPESVDEENVCPDNTCDS